MSAGYNSERSMQECDRNGERIYEKNDFLERKRPSCLPGKGIFRIFKGDGRRYLLHPGEQAAGRPGRSDLPGYHQYWNYAEKKDIPNGDVYEGRAGRSDLRTRIEEHDHEGRVITAEFPEYYVITCYTPNSQDGLKRLDYRMQWEDAFRTYLKELEKKPVIFCGDLNVAHNEIDLKNPKTNRKNADSPMRNARNSRSSWAPDLSILSGIFTRIRKGSTPGGLTGSQREQRTRDGGSTISAFPRA